MARPLGFEPARALDSVMEVFWARGYDGTSMQDIEHATGQKKQSLYRLFGDKGAMYRRALRRYEERVIAAGAEALAGPGSAQARIGRLLEATVARAAAEGDRRGCFLCNASVERAPGDPETVALVRELTGRLGAILETALGASEPYASDPQARRQKAAALVAAHHGLRVLVRAGADEGTLRDAVAATLATV